MNCQELRYPSANGVNEICAYIWTPDEGTDVLGVIQLAHGMAEHAMRYEPFARFLNSKGFAVCANDHVGHGRSANEAFGYMGEKNGHKTLAKDVYKLSCLMKKQYPGVPYILFGHNMGALIVRYACSFWGIEFDGAILSGTGRMIDNGPAAFAGKIAKLRGEKNETKWFGRIKCRVMSRSFKGEDPRYAWLTRDAEQIEQMKADPLIGFPFTYAGARDVLKLNAVVSSRQWTDRMPKNLPVFIFSGQNDPIGGFGREVLKLYERLVDAECGSVEIKLYEDARHDMLFELNKDEVYGDIAEWISDAIVNKQAAES